MLQNSIRTDYLPFEAEVSEIDKKIIQLEQDKGSGVEIRALQKQRAEKLEAIYNNLAAWQTVQVARHPQRPLLTDYLSQMVSSFCQLHGDRHFADDKAIITGFGQIGRQKVLIVGHNKGKDTKEKIECNFGCANPEGYRKAIAKMKLAEKFGLPIVTFIDTPGAYPGIGAEERGQAQAIAYNLMEMSRLKVPIISVVIGEGGSGGALGIAVGDKLAMLEHSYYSVISPEGCAAILWRDGSMANEAAEALKLTSKELFTLGVVDDVIKEPLGGAHRNASEAIYNTQMYITNALRELKSIKTEALLKSRYEKITSIGKPISAGA